MLTRLLIRLFVNALALWVAITLIPGITYEGGVATLLGIAFIFGLVNALVRPIITLLTCPLIVATLGLFVLVINGIMLGLTAWLSRQLDLGFYIDGFWAAVLGALVVSVVSAVASLLIREPDEDDR